MLIDLKRFGAHTRTQQHVDRSATYFDNTVVPARLAWRRIGHVAKSRLRGQRRSLGGHRPHFWFETSEHRFVYCYLYKNASSAFKTLIADESPFAETRRPGDLAVNFLLKHHLISYEDQIRNADRLIFIYRDPIERIASLFKHKFIEQKGAEGTFRSVRNIAGISPEKASFSEVVDKYISPNIGQIPYGNVDIDHHFIPQYLGLAPALYFAAIELKEVHDFMKGALGLNKADRYFKKKINETSHHLTFDEDSSKVSAEVLASRYRSYGELPSTNSLMSDNVRKKIERAYVLDFLMIRSLHANMTRNGSSGPHHQLT